MDWRKAVGRKIRIVGMDDPRADLYDGREGVVTKVGKDWDGQVWLRGTWATRVLVYPEFDKIEFLD